jgi:hypothetical protein
MGIVSYTSLLSFFSKIRYLFPSSHYVLLALFFFAGLELAYALQRWIFLIILIMLGITLVGVVLIRSEEKEGFHPIHAILPALAALGLTAFSLFLPTTLILHIYFVGAAFLFFLLLKYAARPAYPTWNWVISLIVFFVCVASILGWRFLLYAPPGAVLFVLFGVTTLIHLQSQSRFALPSSENWLISLSTGFVLTQVAWVLHFLPFHFIVQAGILTSIYYVIFHLLAISFEHKITKQDILEYISVGALVFLILLLTAHWR